MSLFLIFYFVLFFTSFILLILHFITWKEGKGKSFNEFPFVSVLIAARNEESRILSCLMALDKLDYPKDKIEILVGDDLSEDGTKAVVVEYIKDKPGFQLCEITERKGVAKGKANVLAHLAHKATGEFFFITDADIEVPATWVKGLLGHWNEKIATVSGVTMIAGDRVFDKLQCLEWILAFGMVQTVSERGVPVSAVGNNMMISRKAYESTGGYENIPFSVTEDFELFRQTLAKGWGYKNIMEPEVLASSKAIPDLMGLLKQRKRWMNGALKIPFILVLCLVLKAVFFPMILLTLFLFPYWGALLWLTKILMQEVFMALVIKRMGVKESLLKYFLLFEIYSGVISFVVLLYNMLPVKVEWKGRKY